MHPEEGSGVPHRYTTDQRHVPQRLDEGAPCLVVDTGSWSNVSGADAARDMAIIAMDSGRVVHQNRLTCPLRVKGVGEEIHRCHYSATIPICLQEAAENRRSTHRLETPVMHSNVEG